MTPVARAFAAARAHAGLAFDEPRRTHATGVVEAWLRRHGVGANDAIGPGRDLEELLEDLVIHESYFDRDPDQLRFVDEVCVPALARDHAVLRVWSAGCASGEETYSLAFLLETRGLLDRTRLLGTDLSASAIARARAGRYRGWAVRTGDATPAMRFLERDGDALVVPDELRARVSFERLNLLVDPVPTDQHLVLCRNVLIYFDPAALAVVARKLAASLAPDGWLIVAPSDPRLDEYAELTATVDERGVSYRRRALPVVVARPPAPVVVPPPAPLARRPVVAPAAPTIAAQVRALADRGAHAPALALLTGALAATPLDPELHLLQAVLAVEQAPDAALAALARATYLAPDAPVPLLFAARLHQSRGDLRRARRAYRHALQLLAALPGDAAVAWSSERADELARAAAAAVEALRG